MPSRMGRQIRITCGLLFIYSMTSYIESYLGNLSKLLMWRSILSFFNYSLTSMLLVSVIMIVYPAHKRYLFVPWAVNTICCAVSIPTGIVFRFTESNIFERGQIGYLPFIINGVYLVYLMRCILRNRYWEKNEFFLLAYMAATAFACLIMPLFFSAQTDQWLMLTIAITNSAILLSAQNSAQFDVPVLFLAKRISPAFGFLFCIFLVLGIFAACATTMWTLCHHLSGKNEKRGKLFAVLIALVTYAISFVPFARLVAVLYPLIGYLGIPLLGCIIVYELRALIKKPSA